MVCYQATGAGPTSLFKIFTNQFLTVTPFLLISYDQQGAMMKMLVRFCSWFRGKNGVGASELRTSSCAVQVLIVAACYCLIGCGGSKGTETQPPNYERADFTIAINWKPVHRSLVTDCLSLEVRVLEELNRTVLFQAVLNRPANVDEIDYRRFPLAVPKGNQLVLVRAFRGTDAAGDQLSASGTRIEFVPGSKNQTPIFVGGIADDAVPTMEVLDAFPVFAQVGDVTPNPTVLILDNRAANRNNIYVPEGGVLRTVSPADAISGGRFVKRGYITFSYALSNKATIAKSVLVSGDPIPARLAANATWPARGGSFARSHQVNAPGIRQPQIRTRSIPGASSPFVPILSGSSDDVYFFGDLGNSVGVSKFLQGGSSFLWKNVLGAKPYSDAILTDDGTVYISGASGVQRIRSSDGAIVANNTDLPLAEPLLFAGDVLIAGNRELDPVTLVPKRTLTEPFEFYAFNLFWTQNGKVLSPDGGPEFMHPALNQNSGARVVGFSGSGVILGSGSRLILADPVTGATTGVIQLPLTFNNNITVYNNEYVIVIHPTARKLSIVQIHSQETRTLDLSQYTTIGSIRPIVSRDGILYLHCMSSDINHVIAIDVRAGVTLWSVDLQTQLQYLRTDSAGRVYTNPVPNGIRYIEQAS